MRLPRAAAVTDAFVTRAQRVAAEALHQVRSDLVSSLVPLAAEIPSGERLVLDSYKFSIARRRPELCSEPDGAFTMSPATCRRAVGLAAVDRCLRRSARGPLEAVAQALDAGEQDAALAARGEAPGAPWWARWYASLPDGARAVVHAEAALWATQLWTALSWERFEDRPAVGARDDWFDLPGGRCLTLKGRADVRARVGDCPALVVVANAAPDAGWRSTLVFPAVVACLARGDRAVPVRVMGVWPASGHVRMVAVDADVLERCATDVVSAVAVWVDGLIERRNRGRRPTGVKGS
ncbi:MAG: hypothetical protein ACYDB3_00555 [Acidimicrobiales bacterium]